jgi:hypothetical protein
MPGIASGPIIAAIPTGRWEGIDRACDRDHRVVTGSRLECSL